MRYFVLILAVLVAPLTAAAQGRNGLTIGAGSLGIEAIYTRNLNSYFDIVLGYSALDYNDTFTDDDGNSFTGSATIEAPRIGLQFFPLSFLNMEVGMVFGAPDLSMNLKSVTKLIRSARSAIWPAMSISKTKMRPMCCWVLAAMSAAAWG
ncbi:hypothetical protein N9N22_05285 [Alphaproteobacteria bacterium]|nr:hypothetical protein [Alphaproteobacteria bacterium]